MTLDIIVTHYKEPWETGRRLFESIALQECINFDDVGVIVVNDGEGHELPAECFANYPFEVNQVSIKKGGVSKARNYGLDSSNADWVMFCDFDDMFSSCFGLHLMFAAMAEEKYDTVWSRFTEELVNTDTGETRLVPHDRDWVFIHGKFHRRQFLMDNEIRFHDKLTIHEDAFFNILVQAIAKPERIGGIQTPFYCWRWNPNSVVRKDHDDEYILRTYDHLIRQRIAITEEFLKREMTEEAMTAIVKTVIDCYYDCQQHAWRTPARKQQMHFVENWFAAYLKRYANYYLKADIKQIAAIAKGRRDMNVTNGTMLMEAETLTEWLKHIIDTAKPIQRWEQDV